MHEYTVKLPCKCGDRIYQIRNKRHARGVGIQPRIVACFTVWVEDGKTYYQIEHQGMTPCREEDLGETWFLEESTAKAELERRINGG